MTKVLLAELLARKRWVIGAMVVALIGCVVYFMRHMPKYRSTIEVYAKNVATDVLDDSPSNPNPERLTRLFHSATSTAMFDRLITRFDLHERFGVADTGRIGKSALYIRLADRIKAELTKTNSVQVMVLDEDRAQAADMANAIYDGLVEMYAAEDEAELERMMRIYQVVIDSSDQLAARKSRELFGLATDIATLHKGATLPEAMRNQLLGLEQHLLRSSAQLATSTEDLFHHRRKAGMLLAISQGNEAAVIRLKTRATEDLKTSPLFEVLKWTSIIIMAVGIAVIAVILVLLDQRLTPEPVFGQREQ